MEDRVEEVGEWGNEAGDDAAHEEGVEGALRSFGHGRAGPELGLRPFITLPRRQKARGDEALLRDIGRVESWLVPSRRRGKLDLLGRHWSLIQKGMGADLEISEARGEKGDLEQGGRKQ